MTGFLTRLLAPPRGRYAECPHAQTALIAKVADLQAEIAALHHAADQSGREAAERERLVVNLRTRVDAQARLVRLLTDQRDRFEKAYARASGQPTAAEIAAVGDEVDEWLKNSRETP